MSDQPNSVIFYRGPSMLDQRPIVAIATGLAIASRNSKTGAMVQTYILRDDVSPPEAVRTGADSSICGSCALRGDGNGLGRACYVPVKWAPLALWKTRAKMPVVTQPLDVAALFLGRHVRVGSYGDPVAVPVEVWHQVLHVSAGWTGYTHQWRTCDVRFREFCMASVDDEWDRREARRQGWRTFRTRASTSEPLWEDEITCPASAEAGHKTTCQACQLCRGTQADAIVIKSIAIVAHGSRAGKYHKPLLPFGDYDTQPEPPLLADAPPGLDTTFDDWMKE